MKWVAKGCAALAWAIWMGSLTAISLSAQSTAQPRSFGACKPVSQRTAEIGCWILADQPLGTVEEAQVFWHLDVYLTRLEADKARGPRGMVVESLGKVWLFTIERAGWRPALQGERVAEIGPLPVSAGAQYSALFMESIDIPGTTSPVHTHPGPEAWYTLAGETCLETPNGKLAGRAGGSPVIVPAGSPMQLAVRGEQRRALTLILYQSSEPPSTHTHDWTPKGLCRAP